MLSQEYVSNTSLCYAYNVVSRVSNTSLCYAYNVVSRVSNTYLCYAYNEICSRGRIRNKGKLTVGEETTYSESFGSAD